MSACTQFDVRKCLGMRRNVPLPIIGLNTFCKKRNSTHKVLWHNMYRLVFHEELKLCSYIHADLCSGGTETSVHELTEAVYIQISVQ